MERNPFEVLGLHPNLVRKLSDEELQKVIQSSYRALQKIFHPDLSGREREARELNWAYEQIGPNAPRDRYENFKKSFTRKRRYERKVSELEDTLDEEKRKSEKLMDLMIAQFEERVSPSSSRSIYSLASSQVSLFDVRLRAFLARINPAIDLLLGSSEEKFPEQKRFYRSVRIAKDLTFEVRAPEGTRERRMAVAGLSGENIRANFGSFTSMMARMGCESYATPRSSRRHLYLEGAGDVVRSYEEKIRSSNAKLLLPILEPYIDKGSILVSAGRDSEGFYFALEGALLDVKKRTRTR